MKLSTLEKRRDEILNVEVINSEDLRQWASDGYTGFEFGVIPGEGRLQLAPPTADFGRSGRSDPVSPHENRSHPQVRLAPISGAPIPGRGGRRGWTRDRGVAVRVKGRGEELQ